MICEDFETLIRLSNVPKLGLAVIATRHQVVLLIRVEIDVAY